MRNYVRFIISAIDTIHFSSYNGELIDRQSRYFLHSAKDFPCRCVSNVVAHGEFSKETLAVWVIFLTLSKIEQNGKSSGLQQL